MVAVRTSDGFSLAAMGAAICHVLKPKTKNQK